MEPDAAIQPAEGVRRILIAGGGVDGWLTAAVLSAALPAPRYVIRLIDLPDLDEGPGATAGGQASLPAIRTLHHRIGLDDAALMREAAATVSLGAALTDETRGGAEAFHPFGHVGAPLNGTAFHHHWLRLRALGDRTPFEAYALSAAAARRRRVAPPARTRAACCTARRDPAEHPTRCCAAVARASAACRARPAVMNRCRANLR